VDCRVNASFQNLVTVIHVVCLLSWWVNSISQLPFSIQKMHVHPRSLFDTPVTFMVNCIC